MKFIIHALFLGGFIFLGTGALSAQKFYYVQPGADRSFDWSGNLRQASRIVVPDPRASDFSIAASARWEGGGTSLVLQLQVRDTLTTQVLYEAEETYAFRRPLRQTSDWQKLACRTFLVKNLPEIFRCDHPRPASGPGPRAGKAKPDRSTEGKG